MTEKTTDEAEENDDPWSMTPEENRAMIVSWQALTREEIHARMRAGISGWYDVEWLFENAA